MKSSAIRVFGYTDIHWSDRSELAVAVAKKAQAAFKPHKTVLGGDLHNCGPFSRHAQNKIDEDIEYDLEETELKPVGKFLDYVQRHTLDKTVVLEGNHDEWIERWICGNSAGRALRSHMPSRWHSKGRKHFKWIPFTKVKGDRLSGYKLWKDLTVVHGWFANKYAAQRHLDAARNMSIIFHHTHRADHSYATLFNGQVIEAMSAGCLCRLIPIYGHNNNPTDWVHGFWVAYIGKHSYTAYPVIIRKNSAVLPDGREIKV